ncbi:MAG: hypothetical protein PHS61_00170 [Candidatus Omnitrophica bacterium]|nr:hypothetical protein [Candidatus Omnitrophota bacterium]
MKKILKIAGVALVALAAILILRDQVIRKSIIIATTQVTGASASIEKFSLSLFRQTVTIRGFKLYNPPGFPKEIFVDMPMIHVAYVLGDIIRQHLHFKEINIALKELVIIKNKDGQLNVDQLKVMQEAEKQKGEAAEEEKPAPQLPLQIDLLRLRIGKIIYKDFTAGEKPKIDVYDLGSKEKTYQNITSAQQLVTLILSEALKSTAIKSAKVYAASAVLGVGFLPAGVAITLLGKDGAQEHFDVPFDKAYTAAVETIQSIGSIKTEDKTTGSIKALVDKNDVTVNVEGVTEKTTRVTVSARRLLLPKPQAAGGILQHISEKLK